MQPTRRVLTALAFGSFAAGGLATGALGPAAGAAAWAGTQAAPARGAALRAQASSSSGEALATASDAAGNVFAFWKGQDDNLWEAIGTAGAGSPSWSSGPSAVPGMWPLASEPSAFTVTHSGIEYVYVFWEGTGASLWYAYGIVTPGSGGVATTVGSWSVPLEVSGVAPLGSAPTATYAPTGGEVGVDVFWKGTDDNLWSAVLSGAGGNLALASGPTNLHDGPLGSAPSAGAGSGGNVYVFWQGTGNNTHVWEAFYNAGNVTWSGPIDLGMWTGDTGSPPTVTIGQLDRQYVFWEGQDGNLYYCYWNGLWTGFIGVGMGPLNSAPSAVFTQAGSASGFTVVWKGGDLDMWYAVSNPGTGAWSGPTHQGYGPLDS